MARSQYYQYIQKYFPKKEWERAYNVMTGESGGRADAVGDDYPIRGQTIPSVGLFQIRTLPGRPSANQLKNPEFNVKYAANMQKNQGWGPWTVARKLGYTGSGGQVAGSKTVKNTTMDLDKVKQFYKKAIAAGYSADKVNAFIKDKLKSSKEETVEAEEEFQPEAEVPGGPLPPSYGESVSGQADARAIMRLRRDIQKPENFEDLMRRYGKTFGGELEDSQVREEYNAYQGQEGKWGEAKESEAEVEALKNKTGVTEVERAEFTSQLLGQVETYTSREEALRDFGIYKKAMEEMGVDSKSVLDAIDKKFPEEEKKKNKVLFDLPKFFKKGAEEQVKNPLKPTPFRIYG